MATAAGPDFSTPNRFGDEVVPKHYDVTIRTDLKNLKFSGVGEIELELKKSLNTITINVAPPLVLRAAVLKTQESSIASKMTYDKKLERATLTFPGGAIPAGTARLGLRWDAVLEASMMGYYRSEYDLPDGKGKGYYGLTQFEPTQARRAFPCWDDPAVKSEYTIRMISKKGSVSLSNMDATGTKALGSSEFPCTELLTDGFFEAPSWKATDMGQTEEVDVATPTEGEWAITSFRRSPRMSTYLVAWANGAFESIEDSYKSPKTGQTVPLKLWATADHIDQTKLTLETTKRIIPIYEKIFDIAYPLPKLDTLVASDFDAGAMENFGLITGRTSVFLYDPKRSGIAAKKRVVTVQSHECAHMWFGDLVTMDWWQCLWLNEAFATLMGEVIIIDRVEPEWRVHSSFISDHLSRALQLDALRSSHPIEVPCPDEDTAQQIFDAVSYSKGASVLKMLSNLVGEETFLKGVSLYLKKHAWGNTVTADLWRGIEEASGRSDITQMMDAWTQKIGFPVLNVEEVSPNEIKVTQNRYLSSGDVRPEEDETIWTVPLELKIIDSEGHVKIDHSAVLSTRDAVFRIDDVANKTYKLNGETAGVYRVAYSSERMSKLGDEASQEKSAFSVNDRMGLVQDAATLAMSGLRSSADALTLLSKVGAVEKENLVCSEIADALAQLHSVWWEEPEPVRAGINRLRQAIFSPIAKRLTFKYDEDESPEVTELRTLAISTAAAAGDQRILTEFKQRFNRFLSANDESQIPSDLRASIYTQSVKHGGEAEYLKVLETYRKPATPSHRLAAISALCSTQDKALLKRTFEFTTSSEVKPQDLMYFLASLTRNTVARRDVWTFMKSQWDHISRAFKGNFSIGSLVKSSFASLTTLEDAQDVEKFFSGRDTSMYEKPLKQGLDAVRVRAAWLSRDKTVVQQWLESNGYM